jgi:hypothetical protein
MGMHAMLWGTIAALAVGGASSLLPQLEGSPAALLGVTQAHPDHSYVFGGVTIYHGSGPAQAEYVSKYTMCTGTKCTVSVAVGKRDYGRVGRWCEAASKDVVVSPGSFGGFVECRGPTPWYLTVHVAMRNPQDALTTHTEAVTITVNVIP